PPGPQASLMAWASLVRAMACSRNVWRCWSLNPLVGSWAAWSAAVAWRVLRSASAARLLRKVPVSRCRAVTMSKPALSGRHHFYLNIADQVEFI
ncbi:hypothetical protein, partial [Xylella fastidiosa]|uniref:hypothetical protein n=1 Tax=Xylella fastidiosa TaxID=2371 RepID=UPI001F486ADC